MAARAGNAVAKTLRMRATPAQPVSDAVLADRYLLPGERTRRDAFRRVARALAATEPPALRAAQARQFYRQFLAGAIGAGRIMSNAGSPRDATMINCFVHPIGDGRLANEADVDAALAAATTTLAMGGGVGYDFSPIAPSATRASDANPAPETHATRGVCAAIERFDAACAALTREGTRRGAQMAVLRCDHPDLPAFIDAKRQRRRWHTFNVSVAVTDAFMHAVMEDAAWPLVHRAQPAQADAIRMEDGAWLYGRIPARTLWQAIVDAARESAEPGLLFIDTINAANSLLASETIAATNPCGEQPLPAWGSCVLGPVDLTRLVLHPFGQGGTPSFDFTALSARVRTQVRLLDNVLDATRWPLDAHRCEALGTRRIGIGVTGLADALAMMHLPYDSPEARGAAARIAERMRDAAYAASAALAAERGPYPRFRASDHLAPGRFAACLPAPIRDAIAQHGLRNSHLLSYAPTGTVSLAFADNCSNGIEPAYDWVYLRAIRLDGTRASTQAPHLFPLENHAYRCFRRMFGNEMPLPPAFRRSSDIAGKDQIAMVAALQPFVDAGISKTVTVRRDTPSEEIDALFFMAWRQRLKGVTVFRPDPELDAVLSPTQGQERQHKVDDPQCPVAPASRCGRC